jgi:beta-galactosidase
VVSEYGDWEYYAQNAGLQQEAWANLAPDEASSRQLRWHGEQRLLQQATNFQEAHNDNRKTIAFADGLWVMYDYNRGYAPDIESSGCMDLFRIPKFSHAFFRSQRAPSEGAMAFIASYWTPQSPLAVRVFSNCEEVALSLDGALIERRRPDTDRISTNLPYPPFTFDLGEFRPGALQAVGYLSGEEAARHVVRTPGPVASLALRLDEGGRRFGETGKDVAFVWAELRDGDGTTVPDAWENVFFGATGDVQLVGASPFSSEAGISSILLQSEVRGPRGAVYALCLVRARGGVRAVSDALSMGGDPQPWEVRVTTDGTEPAPHSLLYEAPIRASSRVRAAVFAGVRRVIDADSEAPKFRIAGSTAPVRTG